MTTERINNQEAAPSVELFHLLRTFTERVTGEVSLKMQKHNITLSQLGVLEALSTFGPMHQVLLAEKIDKSSGNLTLVLDNLEKAGLVLRKKDARDRRRFQVSMTDKGKGKFDQLFPAFRKNVSRVLEKVKKEEVSNLISTLKPILQRYQDCYQ